MEDKVFCVLLTSSALLSAVAGNLKEIHPIFLQMLKSKT